MLRGQCQEEYLPLCRVVTVETKVAEAPQPLDIEQPTPEELAPPGTRVLPASFRKDGTRYRPGERLEKQARKWAAKNGGGPEVWTRSDAKATLSRLMNELTV